MKEKQIVIRVSIVEMGCRKGHENQNKWASNVSSDTQNLFTVFITSDNG